MTLNSSTYGLGRARGRLHLFKGGPGVHTVKNDRPRNYPFDAGLGNVRNVFQGHTAIDFGVYGAPETFLIDGKGVIRYKRIGPLTPDVITQQLKPAIDALQKEAP